jgi:hypothetical protein
MKAFPRIIGAVMFSAFCAAGPALWAQTAPKTVVPPTKTGSAAAAAADSAPQSTEAASGAKAAAVSDTYRAVSLGMDIEGVKEQLLADGIFGYRGERDVSLLPTMNRSLIETSGSSFISRAWFQFYEEKLYIMTFKLDGDKVDYYSIYSSLVAKYGEPVFLDPRKAQWGDERVTLTLERPLTVKYVDAAVFADLLGTSGADAAVSDILREDFINEF